MEGYIRVDYDLSHWHSDGGAFEYMEAKLLTEYGVNDLLGYPLRFPQAPICGVAIHDDDILYLLVAHRHLVVPVFSDLLVQ